jgi:hypothetical protein
MYFLGMLTFIHSTWDMTFNPPSVASTSPHTAYTNPSPTMAETVTVQYPMQYQTPDKMVPMDPQQHAVPQQHQQQPYNPQPIMTARDWQQNVASVFDPHGVKRRFNNLSTDLSHSNAAKRAR